MSARAWSRSLTTATAAFPSHASRFYSTYRATGRTAITRTQSNTHTALTSTSPAASSIASSCFTAFSPNTSSSSLNVAGGSLFAMTVRHATKKAGGSSKNSNDSIGKRLGLKKSAGQIVKTGQILMRQRGLKVHPGRLVGKGRDDTLFALAPGKVCFTYLHLVHHKRNKWRKFIHVLQEGETVEQVQAESEQKSKDMSTLVELHRKGIWLASPKQIKMRGRARKSNAEKITKEKEALSKDAAAASEALKSHPLFRLNAQATVASITAPKPAQA